MKHQEDFISRYTTLNISEVIIYTLTTKIYKLIPNSLLSSKTLAWIVTYQISIGVNCTNSKAKLFTSKYINIKSNMRRYWIIQKSLYPNPQHWIYHSSVSPLWQQTRQFKLQQFLVIIYTRSDYSRSNQYWYQLSQSQNRPLSFQIYLHQVQYEKKLKYQEAFIS